MTLDQVMVWVVVGGLAGMLADALVRGISVGVAGAIVVGILGAITGGWLFGQLGIRIGYGLPGAVFTAFVGAALLLMFLRAARVRR